jgi:hypothetical protein
MTVLIAVLVVGLGSLAFRLGPLLGAERLPDAVTRVAGWAGLSVLAAVVVRTVLRHADPALASSVLTGVPAGLPVAPLLGSAAVAVCLLLTARGRGLLVSVTAGGLTYLLGGAFLTALL